MNGKKPIMSAELEKQCLNAVMMFSKRLMYRQWGLHTIRKQGSAVLLEGPPGCGKTAIAEYLALSIRRHGIKEISFADFGSHIPGENARKIRTLFTDAHSNDDMTIYLNECDAILIDRNKLGGDMIWMLEPIDELLMQIEKYPGLVILATNQFKMLDPALRRRLLAIIHVGIPAQPERKKLWQQKLPREFPLRLTAPQFTSISQLVLTGAEIENLIIDAACDCLRRNAQPSYAHMFSYAKIAASLRREGEGSTDASN